MEKATIEELFVNGKDFKFGEVDYTSEEVEKELTKIKKKQQESLDSMKINLNDLRKITFDI